jgi:hypothetical protein
LLGKLNLDMSKAASHNRNTGGHVIEPLLGAINPAHACAGDVRGPGFLCFRALLISAFS